MYIITSTNELHSDGVRHCCECFLGLSFSRTDRRIRRLSTQHGFSPFVMLCSAIFSVALGWLPIIVVCCFKVKHWFLTFALNMHHIYLTFDVLTCFHTGLLTGLLSVGGRDYVKERKRTAEEHWFFKLLNAVLLPFWISYGSHHTHTHFLYSLSSCLLI